MVSPDSLGTACPLSGRNSTYRLVQISETSSVVKHTRAIFRQINKDNPRTHHDALEFPDGQVVLLTALLEGQEATVLQLPAQPVTPAEKKTQERVHYVG
jgi:hypothetical protein